MLPPQLPVEQTWRITEESIETSSHLAEAKMTWENFDGWRQIGSFLFLNQNSQIMHVLPKNAFASPRDVEALRELLVRKLGPAK